MNQERYARHGGVHFVQKAPAEQINKFVRGLPEDRRDSFFEVLDELRTAGLIEIKNDGVFADPYGKLHGTEGCYDGER